MKRPGAALTLALPVLVALAGCNRNTAVGNDREAQVEAPPTPAPIVGVEAGLENVATALLKPETMSNTDLQALGGTRGRCAVKLTEVAFPSFLYEPGGSGAIKLNGKLIVLPQESAGRFADAGLSVTLRPLEGEEGNAGLEGMQMIVVPPGAKDEIGYHGYVQCYDGGEA